MTPHRPDAALPPCPPLAFTGIAIVGAGNGTSHFGNATAEAAIGNMLHVASATVSSSGNASQVYYGAAFLREDIDDSRWPVCEGAELV